MSERTTISDESRDYDLKDIKPDERFVQTNKEFVITMAVYLVFAALMIGNLLLLHGSNILVFGFPLWILLEILIIIGFVVAVIVLSTYVYKDMELS